MSTDVPRPLLISFFDKATKALESCNIKDDALTLTECRSLILDKQMACLEEVVAEYKDAETTAGITVTQVQEALSTLSTTYQDDDAINKATEEMTEAARIALARIALTSECLRTNTTSLNNTLIESSQQVQTDGTTSTGNNMTREEIMEFCALCQAAIRIESVKSHLQDPKVLLLEPLEANDDAQQQSLRHPSIKRVDNLQRLLLQAMGHDADSGLTQLARHVKLGGTDDAELVQIIQQTTTMLLETLGLLSDQREGGVTRVVSVEHSEKIIELGGGPESQNQGAPVSQSMHQDHHLQMAQKAAALRESLVNELFTMGEEDRTALLQQAEQALENFQKRAMELPAGSERINFLRNMDATTQKLLAMHRIWQEHQRLQSSSAE